MLHLETRIFSSINFIILNLTFYLLLNSDKYYLFNTLVKTYINLTSKTMKKLLMITVVVFAFSCQNQPDLSLYKANKEIAEKWLRTYESPSNYELFESLVDKNIIFQSPQYGVGEVGYNEIIAQAKYYMNGFENVTFTARAWLPGVDETTLKSDGSVRVYGTWKGNSIASGKAFSLDSYHYFSVKDGKIVQSGDYFDATGMVVATQVDPETEVTEE